MFYLKMHIGACACRSKHALPLNQPESSFQVTCLLFITRQIRLTVGPFVHQEMLLLDQSTLSTSGHPFHVFGLVWVKHKGNLLYFLIAQAM